ncbi:MAG: hypothetical protein GY797_03340 [Deltaproteobacteria bacterium]|nr:hypothetical protein [Deltaproteobacteria bacterium]
MSNSEYTDRERKVLRFLDEGVKELWNQQHEMLKGASEHERSTLPNLVKAYDLLIPEVARRLSMSETDVADDISSITLVTTPFPNASIGKDQRSGKWVIRVDITLLRFYHEMSKVLSSQVALVIPDGEKLPDSVSFEHAVEATSRLLHGYWNGIPNPKGISAQLIPGWYVLLATIIFNICVWYTIAHELGHYVLLKSSTAPEEYRQVHSRVARYSRVTLGLDSAKLINKWTTEIAADLIGFQFVLSIVGKHEPAYQVYLYHSCELWHTFYGALIFFKYGKDYLAQSRDLHHPPIEMRREALREVAAYNGFEKPLIESQRLYELIWKLVVAAKDVQTTQRQK